MDENDKSGDLSETKAELRSRYLEARQKLARAEVRARSRLIIDRLAQLEVYRNAETVLSYAAAKDNEVDTLPILEAALESGRAVYVPVAFRGGEMRWSRLEQIGELRPGKFGLLEPAPETYRFVEWREPSVALVPGIVFSRTGDRIGYGRGYFDRFLAHFEGTSIGLAYEMQLAESLPVEAHDVAVNLIATEHAVIPREELRIEN